MPLSIVDSLQEIDPKVAFVDSQNQFSKAEGIASSLNQPIPNVGTFRESIKFPELSLNNITNTISAVPLSADELKVELTGKIDKVKNINLDSLQAAIPEMPKAENFQNFDIKSLTATISDLSQDLTGNLSIGTIPPAAQSLFGEFDEFVTKAAMFPARTLDALLTVFKKLLDKLSMPDELLSKIGPGVLTEILSEQVSSLAEQLPSTAIRRLEKNIQRRRALIEEYNQLLNNLQPSSLTKEQIKKLRQDIKTISQEISALDASNKIALTNLNSFNIETFQNLLKNLAQVSSSPDALGLAPLFNSINQYIATLNKKITEITKKLKEFAQKIPQLIEEGIKKAGDIADQATTAITDKLESAKGLLTQLTTYLQGVIQKIKAFIDETCKKSTELVKPIKETCNNFSSTAVGRIDEFSSKIKETTEKLEQSIVRVNAQIETELSPQQLKQKIEQLLDKVTAILDSPQVNNALKQAEGGIKTITDSLEQVTLKPAFTSVVTKSSDLEKKLKAVDVSKLSTASKTALKIGTEVIKQVDVGGTVSPELKAAFDEILAPLENIVTSIEGEFHKIDRKIANLKPGTLAEEFLSPYIYKLVGTLENYKPSKLLKPVEDLYKELLVKMEVLNPKQVLDKLEELYNKLLNVIKSLSPEPITEFLNQQLKVVTEQLDKLPVEALVKKVTDGLSQVDKLMASLGLGDVLKLEFWKNLEELLSFSFADKIQAVEQIRDQLVAKVNAVDDQKLKLQLENMQEAIKTYANNPTVATDISGIEAAVTPYRDKLAQLQTQYSQQKTALDTFTPAIEILVDYRDLRSRLEQLYNGFTATKPESLKPEDILTQLKTIITDTNRLQATQEQRNSLLAIANTKTPEQVLAELKNVIPNELNQQIINPVKDILKSLDHLLEQPRSVLKEIKNVIDIVEKAPGRLAAIFSEKAKYLGDKIRGTINAVKDAINRLGSEAVKALDETYKVITKTVESLRPRLLLNSFDSSDFPNLGSLIQKLREPKDKVSKYINSKLSKNTLLLLGSDSPGRTTAIITDFNALLLDQSFYSAVDFEGVKVTQVTQLLIQNKASLDTPDIIYLNRLLLEAAYPGEIVMNLESIFPYFKDKLAEIYPRIVVDKLDILHRKILQVIDGIPQVLEAALNKQYDAKVLKKTQQLRASIDNIFKALRQRLAGLKSELDIGLEDVSDAFDRLINALPV
jgi:hypothetical protein